MILIAMLCLSAEDLNHKETIIFDIAETFSFILNNSDYLKKACNYGQITG